MRRRLFLLGDIGCGKTTLLRNTPGLFTAKTGGFVTERVLGAGGSLSGFVLRPAWAVSGKTGPAYPFLTAGADGFVRDDRVFAQEAPGLLDEAAQAPFAVLDEFGGLELLVPEFFEALLRFLSSTTPCVGVLKAPGASKRLSSTLSLPHTYQNAWERLYALLRADCDTELFETFGHGDGRAEAALCAWSAEYTQN